MELIERLRAILAKEYGINSDEELLAALDRQKGLEIGIFTSRCGREDLHDVKAVG